MIKPTVKRLLRLLLAAVCLAGCVVQGTRVLAQAPSQGAELLQRLPAAPDPERSVTITYEFTRATSKYKGTEEQLVAKLAAHKAQIEKAIVNPDPAWRQQQLDDVAAVFEDLLRHGEITTLDGQAEIAPGYRAVAEKNADDEKEGWNWTIQRGNKLSEYSKYQSARVSEAPLPRETSLGLFMNTVGLFGKPSASIDGKIREAKSFQTAGGKITVEIDRGTAVFTETPGHQLVLESFRTAAGQGDSTTVTFEDYRTFGGVLVPTRVTQVVFTPEFDVRSAYRLKDVQIDGELTIPFKAAKIEGD